MTITVTTCGECPFQKHLRDVFFMCTHDEFPEEKHGEFRYDMYNNKIHPSCPEYGPFEIITQPKNNDNITAPATDTGTS